MDNSMLESGAKFASRRAATRAGAAMGVAALGLIGAGTTLGASAADAQTTHNAVTCVATAGCFNVMNYGANAKGVVDNTTAFTNAIAAAQGYTGTAEPEVYVPAGSYAFTTLLNNHDSIAIHQTNATTGATYRAIKFVGASSKTTHLYDHVAQQGLLSLQDSGSTVTGVDLNCLKYSGTGTNTTGPCVNVAANNTTINAVNVVGANAVNVIGSGAHAPFAIIYSGPTGASQAAPAYNTGNVFENSSVQDGVNNDGFSFSYQQNGTISNITYFGSRLGLFVDNGVVVNGVKYTPNPLTQNAAQGFWITYPSQNVTIENFTSSGPGGVITGAGETGMNSNITITNETLTSPGGYHLAVGNVTGLNITNAQFSAGNNILFNGNTTSTGINVSGSTIPSVVFQKYLGKGYTNLSATFTNDTYPALTVGTAPQATFYEASPPVGPGTVTVSGGTFANQAGGFYSGTSTKFTVSGVAPLNVAPVKITGTTTLTAVNPQWFSSTTPTYSYQWNLAGVAIAGATSSTFVVPSADAGKQITVTITAKNTTGSTSATSAPVTAV